MDWYMIIVYAILVTGGVSSYLNYRIQRKWFREAHPELHGSPKVVKPSEDYAEPIASESVGSLPKELRYASARISPAMRKEHFDETGVFASDIEILAWYDN